MKKKCICGNEFKLYKIYINIVLLNEALICDKCGRKYKEAIISRIITSLFVFIPLMFLDFLKDIIGFWESVLICFIMFVVLSILTTPISKLKEIK